MHHLYFSSGMLESYPVCLLVPTINKAEISKAYLEPFNINTEEVLVLDLFFAPQKKTPTKLIKAYIEEQLTSVLTDCRVEYLVVADGDYFKALTGVGKIDANLGYVLDCKFGPWKVVYVPNFQAIFYDPEKVKAKIEQGMTALKRHREGIYRPPGDDILKFVAYPKTNEEIRFWLDKLLDMECPLAIDVETFSLRPHKAGIATISFAWSQYEGIAFTVDYVPIEGATEAPFGRQERNEFVRSLLRMFFLQYAQKALYHNIAFDVSVLIYQLYMEDITDTAGLLRGMETLLGNWDCTKLIAYLATNSCAGNKLSLKDQAQEFAGNYGLGEEIEDITKVPLPQLLHYNVIDTCSTWHVWWKHWKTLERDRQLNIYEHLFKPATLDIIQMQLTGLPVNIERVREVKAILEAEQQIADRVIRASPIIKQFTERLNEKWVVKRNEKLKVKRVTLADAREEFNPNSGPQLQDLLYGMLDLPVIAWTKTKQPGTGGDVLKDLENHTKDQTILEFLRALQDFSVVSTVLETFIPALENSVPGKDGHHYLCGFFNLGGTLSGRLSSSNPNLQNLPAGGEGEDTKKGLYGLLIKSCISAPEGHILVGLDFNSLEDVISAVTTKDPNKLKVYTDGFDGHSLRAQSYWPEEMPDIDPNSVESINSIKKKYKAHRIKSKPPTFALTYQGTFKTLMTNCGFSEEEAKRIERNFKKLYKVSIDWVNAKLDQAMRDGFVTVAFGLRVRTPLLAQVIRGTSKTPHEAEAEGRSAGNALGQSWCLLNSRAWSEFMGKVRKSPYRLDIRPCAQIHDAGYALIKDDSQALAWMNEHLVEAVRWQDHPDIWHDQVKIGGELSVFWPSWANEIVIPNGADEEKIMSIIAEKTSAN
jgi:DNA polymerase-1